MTRTRVAAVLGVVAVLSVVATAAVAMSTRDDRPAEPGPATLTVRQGEASFEVPARDWQVEDRAVRVFYTDERGRPVAVVHGPAVYRAGYCGKGSNQAFAGFTRDPIAAWVGALGTAGDVSRETVDAGSITRVEVEVDAAGRCSTTRVEVAMIEAGEARVVLVQDAGTLDDGAVREILGSLT